VNVFFIFLFLLVIGLFGGIFFVSQKDSLLKDLTVQDKEILPTGADVLRVISPAQQQTQGQVQGQTSVNTEAVVVPTFGVEDNIKASYSAVIKTSKGDIGLTLFGRDAPKTVKNFIDKAKGDYYKNLTFHRVEDWVIQGGDPKGDGSGGGQMQSEMNNLPFVEGSLGVARRDDIKISNDSQFFITKSEASWLNGKYTNFGVVTKGMDVVKSMVIGDKILGIMIE
jgi:peptidyl-prolyl cis-trans isomerase B (cyclophilin B)